MTHRVPKSVTGRRSYLKLVTGSLLGSTAVAGSASASGHLEDNYGTVIDVVEAGAENDGSESVSPVLQDLVDDDTLLKFPPGRYYMDEQVRFTDFWNFGLVGDDATLVPANYWDFNGPQYRLFRLGTHYAPGDQLQIENFVIDQEARHTGIRAFEAQVQNGLVVRNVDFAGRHDSGTWGPGLFTITDPDGNGLVKGFRAPDGAQPNDEAPGDLRLGPTGVLCNYHHQGTLVFRDCVLGGFPDNGLYASGGTGRVVVDGGRYWNSGISSIRLGVRRGRIHDVDIVVDGNRMGVPQEGIRLDYGSWVEVVGASITLENPTGEAIHVQDDMGGTMIEDTDIRIESPAYPGVKVDSGAGPTYFKNVDVEINDSANALLILGEDAGEVGLQNVTITGDATGSPIRHAIRCERDHVDFRYVNIDQPGGDWRRGIVLLGSDYFLYDCHVETRHRPVSVRADNVWVQACYCNSYDNAESIRLYDEANDIRLKNNTFPDGIENDGASNVRISGTDY